MDTSCTEVRASLSARIDGEDAPLTTAVVDGHVRGCADCTAFAAGLPLLEERVAAFRTATSAVDRTADVLAAVGAERRAAATEEAGLRELRWLVGLAAAVKLVLAITALVGVGADHVARDLAVYELAAAGGLAAVAWRPTLAAGMLPVVAVAAVAGVAALVADVVGGGASLASEVPHLVLAIAVWPLATLARATGAGGTVETA